MQSSSPLPEQAFLVAELNRQFVIFLGDNMKDEWSLQGLMASFELGRRSGKRIVVDLSEVEFLSAEALGALLHHVRKRELPLRLAGPLSRITRRRLEVTGTLSYFEVFPTLLDALAQTPGSGRTAAKYINPSDRSHASITARDRCTSDTTADDRSA
ncbi:STAS domain-containing protein [Streptomyces sp. NPDC059639]|uniref:STAS domain-containing protein n=1 Tax=Streptomyces sp. NPDC059639 TaxID=3346891 RepID=UPI00367836D5